MDEAGRVALGELRVWSQTLHDIVNSGEYFHTPFAFGQTPSTPELEELLYALAMRTLPLLVRLGVRYPEMAQRLNLRTTMLEILARNQG